MTGEIFKKNNRSFLVFFSFMHVLFNWPNQIFSAEKNDEKLCEQALKIEESSKSLFNYQSEVEAALTSSDYNQFSEVIVAMVKNPDITPNYIYEILTAYAFKISKNKVTYEPVHDYPSLLIESLIRNSNIDTTEKDSFMGYYEGVTVPRMRKFRAEIIIDLLRKIYVNEVPNQPIEIDMSTIRILNTDISFMNDLEKLVPAGLHSQQPYLFLSAGNDFDSSYVSSDHDSSSGFLSVLNSIYLNMYDVHPSDDFYRLSHIETMILSQCWFTGTNSLFALTKQFHNLKNLFIIDPRSFKNELQHFLKENNTSNLEVLIIHHTDDLDDFFVEELVKTKMFKNLKKLSFSLTRMTDRGLKILSEALSNSRLEVLDLGNNSFSASAILDFLNHVHPTNLKKINFSFTRDGISPEEMKKILNSSGLDNLIELHLHNNNPHTIPSKDYNRIIEDFIKDHPKKSQVFLLDQPPTKDSIKLNNKISKSLFGEPFSSYLNY
jgi:hypothetical protein